jgi:hypothetical protein
VGVTMHGCGFAQQSTKRHSTFPRISGFLALRKNGWIYKTSICRSFSERVAYGRSLCSPAPFALPAALEHVSELPPSGQQSDRAAECKLIRALAVVSMALASTPGGGSLDSGPGTRRDRPDAHTHKLGILRETALVVAIDDRLVKSFDVASVSEIVHLDLDGRATSSP